MRVWHKCCKLPIKKKIKGTFTQCRRRSDFPLSSGFQQSKVSKPSTTAMVSFPTSSHCLLFISTPSLPHRLSPPQLLSSLIFTSVLTPPQMSCSVSPWRSKTQSLYLYPFRLSAQDFDHFALNSGKENKFCAPQPKAAEDVEITALLYAYLWTRVQKWVCLSSSLPLYFHVKVPFYRILCSLKGSCAQCNVTCQPTSPSLSLSPCPHAILTFHLNLPYSFTHFCCSAPLCPALKLCTTLLL